MLTMFLEVILCRLRVQIILQFMLMILFGKGYALYRMESSLNGFQAQIFNCSSSFISNTTILASPLMMASRLHCSEICAQNLQCDLAVFQVFPNGTRSCLLLQISDTDTGYTLDVSTSTRCSIIRPYLCYNRGMYENNMCVCPQDLYGERCEYITNKFCNGQWRMAFSTSTVSSAPFFEPQELDRAKLKYNDTTLGVTVVLRAAIVRSSATENFFFESYVMLEKSAWNLTATSARRRFLHFRADKSYQVLIVRYAKGSYSESNFVANFDFFIRDPTLFQVRFTDPVVNCTLMTSTLAEGYDVFEQTTTTLYDSQNIVFQKTDIYHRSLINGHFMDPPKWYNFKMIWGNRIDVAEVLLGQEAFDGFSNGTVSGDVTLNICWMPLSLYKSGNPRRKRLLGYLQKGHAIRIYFDGVYYSVIEVLAVNGEATFMLDHHMTKTGIELLNTQTYGVRTIVSSFGKFQTCVYAMEGETLKGTTSGSTSSLRWFVDTKTWTMAFSVFSNGSVSAGSLSVLSKGVLSGTDVRLWIKWTLEDKSRYMDTHMSSVTSSGKVSTEGVVTWATDPQTLPTVTLSPSCNYEYVLVTTDGYVEVMTYNIFTAPLKTVLTDVMITWFLN